MKYIISESKINDVIYNYINDNYFFDDYNKDVLDHKNSFSFYNERRLVYVYFKEYSGYYRKYIKQLELQYWVAEQLTSIFGEIWEPIFIGWFQDKTELEVASFEIIDL